MINKLKKILNRPFPIIETTKEKLLTAISAGIIVFSFLLIFQPFGLDDFKNNKFIYFAGYGFITTLVILFNAFISMNLFKNFFLPEKWNIGKSLIHNFVIIIPIALFNWLYFISFQKPENLDYSFFHFILITLAVGIFPSGFFVYYFEHKLRSKNQQLAERVNQQIELHSQNNSEIKELSFSSQNPPIEISFDDFVCVKSMGNYVTLYFMEENQLKKEIIRLTMKKIETDLLDNKQIVRCHKSYIVNLNKVTITSGNARALYLHLDHLKFQIPVSRNYSKEIIYNTI